MALSALAACTAHQTPAVAIPSTPSVPPFQPVATLQDLMQSEVDASADSLWDAVETDVTRAGEVQRQPHAADQWQAIRRQAIVLVEAGNLLLINGRPVSAAPFAAEAQGALDSSQIADRIASNRDVFNQFAVSLRSGARAMLEAIDAKDPTALVKAGGTLDEICESCHLTFWYPNQVIPPLPAVIPPQPVERHRRRADGAAQRP
jgi:cytochrome c556